MTCKAWFDVKGDETLALDWPLNEDSLVWEIGGFEGRWAAQIYDRYRCRIKIFEPQGWAVEKMKKRFEGIGKIQILPYGLMISDGVHPLGHYFTDGASILQSDKDIQECYFESISDQFEGGSVDLCLMNVEGAEYELIPHLVHTGNIRYFNYFWCQFHPGLIDKGLKRYSHICRGMRKTHRLLWSCYPTAVAWRRK